jgi:hypothetical protein
MLDNAARSVLMFWRRKRSCFTTKQIVHRMLSKGPTKLLVEEIG